MSAKIGLEIDVEASCSALSPFAGKMLSSLQRLSKECESHPCGGFTTDDMQWMIGVAFTPEEELHAALDELTEARLIHYCGEDEEDAIGLCYELLMPLQMNFFGELERGQS